MDTQSLALDIARQGIEVGFMVLMPILAVALFIGLLVSILQAITQIQEMTLTFVPKLLAVGVLCIVLGNWMLTTLVTFTRLCLERIATVG